MKRFPEEELVQFAAQKVPFFLSALHALCHPECHQEWSMELEGIGQVELAEAEIANPSSSPERKAELIGERFSAIGKAVTLLHPERRIPALYDFCLDNLHATDFTYLSNLQEYPVDIIGLMPPEEVLDKMFRDHEGNRGYSRALAKYIADIAIQHG